MQQRSSDIVGHGGELQRALADAFQRPIDITEKPTGKPMKGLDYQAPGCGRRPSASPATARE
jgi:hypothetical protein